VGWVRVNRQADEYGRIDRNPGAGASGAGAAVITDTGRVRRGLAFGFEEERQQ
jgi:hypothetical protein